MRQEVGAGAICDWVDRLVLRLYQRLSQTYSPDQRSRSVPLCAAAAGGATVREGHDLEVKGISDITPQPFAGTGSCLLAEEDTARQAGRVDVSIICVNWNSADYLRECLASVYQQTHGISF